MMNAGARSRAMTAKIRETRQSRNWEEAIGAKVRETMASAEMARYFNVKTTPKRARVTLLQLEFLFNPGATAGPI
jgi:hypothetical protein